MESDYLRKSKSLKKDFLFPFILACALLLLYSVSLGHNFLFDEENVILRNPYLKSFSNIPQIFTHGFFYPGAASSELFLEYYRPFSVLTFMTDYFFWKTDPFGYNLTSLFFQIILCLFLYFWLKRYLLNAPAAFLAALFYAVHPIHTEAIGHVSCRSETLAALALLMTLHFYLKGGRLVLFLAGILSMGMGFLSKESSVLIPFYLLGADLFFRRDCYRERIQRLWPYFFLSGAYILFRLYFSPVPVRLSSEPLKEHFLRLFSMGLPFVRYFRTLLWPPDFQLFSSIDFMKNFLSVQLFSTLIIFAIFLGSFFQAVKLKKPAALAILFIFIGFVPYLQWVHFYPEWAEHFLTSPALGAAMIAGLFLRALVIKPVTAAKKICLGIFAIYLLLMGIKTYQRNSLYNDPEAYYQTLAQSSSPYAVHGMQALAKIRMADKKFTEAESILEAALEKNLNRDISCDLLGWCRMNLGKPEDALRLFLMADAINPDILRYKKNAAWALEKLGRHSEASLIYKNLIAANPGDYAVYRQLMLSEEMSGRVDEAAGWGRKGIARFSGMKFEQAAIAAGLLKLYYRQNLKDAYADLLKDFTDRYGSVPWYGDVGRFLSGQISEDDFLKRTEKNFPGFAEEADFFSRVKRQSP